MKRNLMPLLGVAFVAAVVATGIFYGLLIPRLRSTSETPETPAVQAAERANLEDRTTPEGMTHAIPANMRAVSIHPSDSGGIVSLLKSGSRVDIQAISRGDVNRRVARLLENVEVLSTGGGEASNSRPVVTVLVALAEVDRITLADASEDIRLLLRNPEAESATLQQTKTNAK
jgi:Flp pilus assembly protein CpaB